MKRILSLLLLVLSITIVTSSTLLQPTPQPTKGQLSRLGLKSVALKEVRTGIWTVTKGGKVTGHVVSSQSYAKGVRGFKGETPVLVFIDKKGIIKGLTALPNNETPEFFNTAEPLLKRYEKQRAASAAAMNVDAVTGATFSSRGLIGNVQAALKAYNAYVK